MKVPGIIDALDAALTVAIPIGGPHHQLWPLLGAARCLRLLRGMMTLLEAKLRDVVGVLARAIYESWMAAMYVRHGGQQAVDELAGDFMHYFGSLAEFIGVELPANTPVVLQRAEPKRLSTWALAESLERCLPDDHPLKGYALAAYEHLFAGESLFSAHGRVGSFLQHQEAAEDAIAIKQAGRETPDQLDRVWESAALVSVLAIDALGAIGKDTDRLIKLVDELGLPAYPERNEIGQDL